jgi:hypothetical protein
VTAEGWNALVDGLTTLYQAVISLSGATLSLDVAVTGQTGAEKTASAPLPDADVIAEPIGGGSAIRAVPPFGTRSAHLLAGLAVGDWRVSVQAPGYTTELLSVTLPAKDPLAVTLARAGTVVPDVFGTGLQAALDQLAALGIALHIVLDTVGGEVSRTNVPAEYVKAPVLAQSPPPDAVLPASGRVSLVVASPLQRQLAVDMPVLTGLTIAQAQAVLEQLGLRLGSSTVYPIPPPGSY